jgi:hypothetical protein
MMVPIHPDSSLSFEHLFDPSKFNSRLYKPLVRPLRPMNPRSPPSWLSAPLDPPTMNAILQLGRVNISGCLKIRKMGGRSMFSKFIPQEN